MMMIMIMMMKTTMMMLSFEVFLSPPHDEPMMTPSMMKLERWRRYEGDRRESWSFYASTISVDTENPAQRSRAKVKRDNDLHSFPRSE